MTDNEWHDEQVIEANVDAPDNPRRVLCRAWNPAEGRPEWMSIYSGVFYGDDQLSDVRVIVDRDGRVAPPPITDEMRERVKDAITDVLRENYGYVPYPCGRQATHAALTAALGGEQS